MPPVSRARAYLRQPIVLTRRAFLALALATGLTLGAATMLVLGLADERSARSADARAQLKRELTRERAARRAQDAFSRRLARQEQPTDREFEQRIRRFLAALDRHPDLRRRLRKAGLAIAQAPRPGVTTITPSTASDPGPVTRPPRRVRRPAAPGPTPSSPRPTTSTPAPPPPTPLVNVPAPTVTTPAGPLTGPSICPDALRPLVGVGCP